MAKPMMPMPTKASVVLPGSALGTGVAEAGEEEAAAAQRAVLLARRQVRMVGARASVAGRRARGVAKAAARAIERALWAVR